MKLLPLPWHSQVLVSARELTLSYGGHPVCGPLTFQIQGGQSTALVGRNGCGKSSVLRAVLKAGGAGEGEKFPDWTGSPGCGARDDHLLRAPERGIFAGIPGGVRRGAGGIEEHLLKALLRKLDFSREQFEKDMGDYSAGQKKKVLLAGSLCTPAHLYVWDEPLNYIDVFPGSSWKT